MENLKIYVSNIDESKEAQELFFALGFRRSNGDKIPSLSETTVMVRACVQMGINYIDSKVTFGYENFINANDEYRAVNMAQLRDLVVLHRNDPTDSNCKDDTIHTLYKDHSGVVYYFHTGKEKWEKSHANANSYLMGKVVMNPETLNDKVATAEVARKCSIDNMEALSRVINGLPVEFSHDGVKWYELTQEHRIYKLHADINFRIPPKKMEINGEMYDWDQAKDLIQRYFQGE